MTSRSHIALRFFNDYDGTIKIDDYLVYLILLNCFFNGRTVPAKRCNCFARMLIKKAKVQKQLTCYFFFADAVFCDATLGCPFCYIFIKKPFGIFCWTFFSIIID